MRNAKQPRAPGSPEEWLDFAKSGLQMAEVGKRQLSIRRELVCFHAQHAAEKAIKGVLLSWTIDFPWLTTSNNCPNWRSERESHCLKPYRRPGA